MIEVYKISTYSVPDNRFGVGRTEDWEEKCVATFAIEKEANDYIRKESLKCTTIMNYLIGLPRHKWPSFVDEFCFTNDLYFPYRRLFVGPIDKSKMKVALKTLGIQMIKNPNQTLLSTM
jgi:hypothetical protein